jgi:hypothetical protein
MDLSDICCVAQFDVSRMGAVGRDATRFRRGEHSSGFCDGIDESGDKDGVVREGTSGSWRVNVVISTVTVVVSGAAAVTGGERDDDVRRIVGQWSGRRHGVVRERLPGLQSS